MPRYHFHTQIGDDTITDTDGADLRDPDHAWRVAQATIRASMSDPQAQTRLLAASLIVTDAESEVVFEFPFSEGILPAPTDDGTVH